MQSYEFRIFGASGGVSLIVQSCHASDTAAIRRARAFAGTASFEVWRDLERLLPEPVYPSVAEVMAAEPACDAKTRLYEFKLSSARHQPLLFVAALMSDELAADHARRLLKRHPEMTDAQIWRGMSLIRQV
ncbi:MAG TPA: hypothetical protein VN175_11010 [Rhizomicrobium sp.]|nr:hypothetical protein [Rhizomicrobium sp.]